MKNSNIKLDYLMSSDEIIQLIKKDIDLVKDCYTFASISDEEYIMTIKKTIENIKNDDKNKNKNSSYLLEQIKIDLDNLVTEKIKNDNNNTIIINYLNKKIDKVWGFNGAVNHLSVISLFFEKYSVDANLDLVINLIDKCVPFNTLSKKIYDNKDKYSGDDEIFDTIVDAYRTYNKVDNEDDLKEEFDFSKVDDVDTFKALLNDIHRYTIPTAAETEEYFKRIKNNDDQAKKEFATRNLGLVLFYAYKFNYTKTMVLLDRFEEGVFGLFKAIDDFDISKGYKFSTYASHWIKQSIRRAIEKKDRYISIPTNVTEKINKITRVEDDYQQINGELPSDEYVGKKLRLVPSKVKYLRKLNDAELSLNVSISDEGQDTTVQDCVVDYNVNVEDSCISKCDAQIFRNFLDNCTVIDDRAKEILKMRFGFYGRDMTQSEVAQKFNITTERVRQIEGTSIVKLGKAVGSYDFINYLDYPDVHARRRVFCEDNISPRRSRAGLVKKTTIYSFFEDTDKDVVDQIIASLYPDEVDLIKKRFGEDLAATELGVLNEFDRNRLYSAVIPKMRKRIKELDNKELVKTK